MVKHSKAIPGRSLRVADQIQKDLAQLIAMETDVAAANAAFDAAAEQPPDGLPF